MSSYGFKEGSLIDLIYDPTTGKEVLARDVVKDDHTGLTLRTELKTAKLRGSPLYLCPLCHTPIYLKSGVEKQGQYFAHWPEYEKSCRWMEKHEYSQEQIRARRFHGQRESHAHKQTKGFVYKSLKADPSFSDIKVEKVWKSTTDEGKWRKPDVSAFYEGPNGSFPMAFEIQLSSTFLSEIVERREFYRKQGALLVWIFRRFVRVDPKLTQLDIFYPNNLNAFVVNPASLQDSLKSKSFHMECHWAEPVLSNDLSIGEVLNSDFVAFKNLTLNQPNQHAFHFDYAQHKEALQQQVEIENRRIEKEKAKAEEERRKIYLRNAAEAFVEYCSGTKWPNANSNEMIKLREACRGLDIPIPEDMYPINTLVQSIASLKQGEVVGFGYYKLLQVANHMAQNNSSLLLFFTVAAEVYKKKAVLEKEDWKQTWYKKKEAIWNKAKKAQGVYVMADEQYRALIFMLFPELEEPFDDERDRLNTYLRINDIGGNIHIHSAAELQ